MYLNYSDFIETTNLSTPPNGLDPLLLALWHVKKGHWDEAHNIVQDEPGQYACWIHALLHKLEGDNWNASYWYRQAGVKNPELSTGDEWEMIVRKLIAANTSK